jgi:hypothetical protein
LGKRVKREVHSARSMIDVVESRDEMRERNLREARSAQDQNASAMC